MSEPMALERLAAEWLRFEGYWTELRVPYRKKNTFSDIDVLGFRKQAPGVVAVECKGWGKATEYRHLAKGRIDRIRRHCWRTKRSWASFQHSNKRLGLGRIDELRLVWPGSFRKEATKIKLEKELTNKCGFKVRIFGVRDLIVQLENCVRNDLKERGKRYPDTALEMIRWVVRSGGRICWEKH